MDLTEAVEKGFTLVVTSERTASYLKSRLLYKDIVSVNSIPTGVVENIFVDEYIGSEIFNIGWDGISCFVVGCFSEVQIQKCFNRRVKKLESEAKEMVTNLFDNLAESISNNIEAFQKTLDELNKMNEELKK